MPLGVGMRKIRREGDGGADARGGKLVGHSIRDSDAERERGKRLREPVVTVDGTRVRVVASGHAERSVEVDPVVVRQHDPHEAAERAPAFEPVLSEIVRLTRVGALERAPKLHVVIAQPRESSDERVRPILTARDLSGNAGVSFDAEAEVGRWIEPQGCVCRRCHLFVDDLLRRRPAAARRLARMSDPIARDERQPHEHDPRSHPSAPKCIARPLTAHATSLLSRRA